ncbi:MAG: ABC transporter ATP-binding protein [Elusimicrobia bacterium]|nr:ABC transporter ATP-binding protein [Elusimicrobiota bacterium]
MAAMTEETRKPLVRARGLSKSFAGRVAVDRIDFDIFPGEVVGFLGPNGAGKTTTIRMLLNILRPTDGELTIFGESFQRARESILRRMNASSGATTLPGKLSVLENLKVFGDMYGIAHPGRRIRELSGRFDLESLLDRPLYALSTGQQVRVSLAKAFLNRPKLLLLDEPTSSLDPDVADRVRSLLMQAVREEETTVFLTSHNMSEVEKVCSRVVFLNEGRIQAQGTPKELARRIKRWTIHLRTRAPLADLGSLKEFEAIDVRIDHRDATIEIDSADVGPFLTHLVQRGAAIETISIREPTLEDFFLQSARAGGDADA